ncbi:MAG: ABC transporter ATP-binding protein [Ardenticatenales bacterium]|nr:ABC transporter ATP-binding protein [Ardenticatenales bacterium]
MTLAIETKGLSKQFGAVKAVADLDLQVRQGEIYAFLGRNGAGKTTTIRMLLGMIRPTAGGATILGRPVSRGDRTLWASVGYLVETADAYPELTTRQNLEMMRRLRPGVAPAAVNRVIDQLGLGEYADRRARALSLGNRQRLGVAKALLHNPQLLILDEPANGLDPAGIVEMRELLQRLARNNGITIFMSSHILGEVARLAERIGIINDGRLVQELSVAEMEQQRHQQLIVATRDNLAAQAVLAGAGYAVSLTAGQQISLRAPDAIQHPEQIATLLVENGQPPTTLTLEKEELESYFLRLTGRNEVPTP